MKKAKAFPYIIGAISAIAALFIFGYLFCPALNVKSLGLWILIDVAIFIFCLVSRLFIGLKSYKKVAESKKKKKSALHIGSCKSYIFRKTLYRPYFSCLIDTALVCFCNYSIQRHCICGYNEGL